MIQDEEEHRNLFYYLRFKNTNIFDETVKAFVAGIEMFPERFDIIIDDLIEFYNSEMSIIEVESFKVTATTAYQSKAVSDANRNIAGNERINRIAVS